MKNRIPLIRIVLFTFLFLGFSSTDLGASEFENKFLKLPKFYFYPQANINIGSNLLKGGEIGFGNSGAPTQLNLEIFSKSDVINQIGYTKSFDLVSMNGKFLLSLESLKPKLNFVDFWAKFATKYDRFNFFLGHRPIAYGRHPRIEVELPFLPTLAKFDLGFSKDKGIFVQLPLSSAIDFASSLSVGLGDDWDHGGTWVIASRVGTKPYYPFEIGIFSLIGELPDEKNRKDNFFRVGGELIYKFKEKLKTVNQLVLVPRDNKLPSLLLMNDLEIHPFSDWVFGVSHLRDQNSRGRVNLSISYKMTRSSRIRLNGYYDYINAHGLNDRTIALQACYGCGLRK